MGRNNLIKETVLRRYVKERYGHKTGKKFMSAIEGKVKTMIDDAVTRCHAVNRKVLLDRDL